MLTIGQRAEIPIMKATTSKEKCKCKVLDESKVVSLIITIHLPHGTRTGKGKGAKRRRIIS